MNTVEPALAICGLDCTGCTVFQAAGHPETTQRIARWFREERGVEVGPEQIRCAGCRGDPAVQWTDDCAIRTCAQARRLSSCSACLDLPCAQLSAWAEGDERHTAALVRLRSMREER